jgi:AcrR family transcriptional regulator
MMLAAMTDTTLAPRGRPRSAEVDHAISAATLALLAEDGWAGLTMTGVAERAGVSTATLYRRFSSKEDLVCAAVATKYKSRPVVDHGSLEADLRAKLGEIVERFHGESGAMVKGVIGEAVRNPRLGDLLRTTVAATGRDDLRRIVERAVERSEIPKPDDIDVTVSLIAGPLFHRFLMTGEPVTPRVVDRLVPLLLAALGATPSTRRARRSH